MELRKHYVHNATKNAAVALNMAQQVLDNKDLPPYKYEVQEFVQIINATSLALQRVCTHIQTRFNTENENE